MLQPGDGAVELAYRPSGKEGAAAPASRNASPRFDGKAHERQKRPTIALNDLVSFVAASFRGHPHINNVLTHISGADRGAVERALQAILDPRAGRSALSPLAWNLVDLMCADRGVTGRILKPFYRELLVTLLGDALASHLIAHITSLFLEREMVMRSAPAFNPAGGSGSAGGAGAGQ
jgi:hypothetical protein